MNKFLLRLVLVCLLITGVLFFGKSWLLANGLHFSILLLGNILLALISALSFYMTRKGKESNNSNLFVRMVMGAMLLKMMCMLLGVLLYVLAYRPFISKPTIFILLGMYIVYTVVETASSFRLNKTRS
ncbi:hypothetical protein GA0116948_105187 [Chitinophaga costaii]|uniref:ATP synthase I chain n=1 Tax=Chitinophaga costaii TaxID=1335309 RepID=A0A1C4DBK8_9BACT|nr:hypothetical protein [Chitinophaga costaii]PUZ24552.1 hypothetical protein DCM91_11695 [Chitinophaga costaii]SCC28759.1 hypothetical protein GA0116948_105187 [Chitinophaga costaii]